MLISEIHNDDLGEIVGHFRGIPVRSWNVKASERREDRDIVWRIEGIRRREAVRAAEAAAAAA